MTHELETFQSWGKIARLNRKMTVTEKLDGTNAQISIRPALDAESIGDVALDTEVTLYGQPYYVRAGSRNKWIAAGKQDNAGFAGWVRENAQVLAVALGEGRHYGEWWGQGIQRKYGLDHKRFSLFNVWRWSEKKADDELRLGEHPVQSLTDTGLRLSTVPVLYVGPFSTEYANAIVAKLIEDGSHAAPGFMDPEGVIVYQNAGQHTYKITAKNDETPKGQV